MAKKSGAKKPELWKTLQHNGILFHPEYRSRMITIRVNGQEIKPTIEQEEMAYQWAKKKDTPYAQDPKFQENFTKDFVATLGDGFDGTSYEDIDFSNAYRVVEEENAKKENMSKEERRELAKERREKREELKEKYGTAQMNGKPVELGNYMAEPPGIFIGRGDHPLRGKWKPRVTHKDVTLNLGRGAKVPDGDWAKIVHQKDGAWIARWKDHVTGNLKYVWFADNSPIKMRKDEEKYEKASALGSKIGIIRDQMVRDMKSDDERTRTIATACYLIYRTAMRVGDEKDEDEADTVGATTLRKEHLSFGGDSVEFKFLGKDSIEWSESVKATGDDRQLVSNLMEIAKKARHGDEIFGDINSTKVNKYYSSIAKGVSAKVFRTYLATRVVKEYLYAIKDAKTASHNVMLHHAKMANLKAAVKCNHKRTIPKNFEMSLQKKKDRLDTLSGKMTWIKTQERLKKVKEKEPKTELQEKKKRARIRKLNALIRKQKQRHKDAVEKLELDIKLAKKTKDYNVGTSLRNYIDPRIYHEWMKDEGIEWKKMYTPALQKKFKWVVDKGVGQTRKS